MAEDSSTDGLVERLCVAAGALMEDYSGVAVSSLPAPDRVRPVYSGDHPLTKVMRKHARHPCRLLRPAQSLNQKTAPV